MPPALIGPSSSASEPGRGRSSSLGAEPRKRGSADIDFYHGYSTIRRGEDSRLDKALRPFEEASGHFIRAGGNLLGRAVRGESAYPGLPALIAEFYDALRQDAGPSPGEGLLAIARLADSVRRWPNDP